MTNFVTMKLMITSFKKSYPVFYLIVF